MCLCHPVRWASVARAAPCHPCPNHSSRIQVRGLTRCLLFIEEGAMTRKLLLAGALAALATPLIAQSAAPAPQPVRPPLAQSPAPLARAPMAQRVLLRSEVDAQVRTHFARMDA